MVRHNRPFRPPGRPITSGNGLNSLQGSRSPQEHEIGYDATYQHPIRWSAPCQGYPSGLSRQKAHATSPRPTLSELAEPVMHSLAPT